MTNPPHPKPARRLTFQEKIGHIWGGIFLLMVVILSILLFGKACFFDG